MSKIIFVILCFSFVPISRADFWDGFPIISQIKSLILAIEGDSEGAKEVQENFVRQMPLVS